ncbi:MAG: hypothetical protein HY695_06275 [Deltaproteobacteria bacterium]|nr:hypothetical protein [Deltaproteobacteria bacterium]
MTRALIRRISLLWVFIQLSGLAYAEIPAGHYEINFDQQADVWDVSGSYHEEDPGISMDFTISQDNKGKITGLGSASGSEDGISVNLNFTIVGSIKSVGAVTRTTLNMKFVGTATDGFQVLTANGNLALIFNIDTTNALLVGTMKGKVCVKRLGCESIHESALFDLPPGEDGTWDLVLDVQSTDGKKLTGAASAVLSNGRTVPLALSGQYISKTDLAKLSLKGSGGTLTLQANAASGQIFIQKLKAKILGQTVTQ